MDNLNHNYKRPPYSLGYLGLMPLVGAFVGVALMLYGLFKYRDKKLVLIGLADVLFTIFIYGCLFIYNRSGNWQEGFIPIAKDELNGLTKNIEFYKIQHGYYPDSLEQLKEGNEMIMIFDPVQKPYSKLPNFRYKRERNGYRLFSAGVDGIAGTEDDLYPIPPKMKSDTSGLILPHNKI